MSGTDVATMPQRNSPICVHRMCRGSICQPRLEYSQLAGSYLHGRLYRANPWPGANGANQQSHCIVAGPAFGCGAAAGGRFVLDPAATREPGSCRPGTAVMDAVNLVWSSSLRSPNNARRTQSWERGPQAFSAAEPRPPPLPAQPWGGQLQLGAVEAAAALASCARCPGAVRARWRYTRPVHDRGRLMLSLSGIHSASRPYSAIRKRRERAVCRAQLGAGLLDPTRLCGDGR